MGKLALDLLEPGMVVGSDVHDRTGRFLLGAGAELTRKHLMVFRTWGVDEVDIAGVEEADATVTLPPEVTQEMLQAAEVLLAPLFKLSNRDHPAMKELFRQAALRKAAHVSS